MIRIIHYLYINKKRFFTARILTKRCFLSCLLLKNGKDNYLWIYFRTFAPKIEISMNKKYLLPIITTLLIILSCGNQQNSLRLADIDSLVSIEKYDSAYQELMRIKQDLSEDKESQAHFYLLLTQTSLLTNHALTPDSLINISIAYYEENGNDEKLSDAYYYKAECQMQRKDYASAIILCKKAYGLAAKANSYVLQYKTASLISHINCLGGDYNLQLEYAKRALSNAIKTKRKRWIAYSYNDVNEAYQYKGLIDSAIVYAEKTIPFLDNINQNELPYFLNNIGYVYIMKDPKKAKEFFEKSISLKPLSRTLENLAFIYSKEGNKEKAYELWKNALYCDDDIPVDKIIYHILQYNLSHSDLDGACEQLSQMVSIKDSLNTALSDRSIERIQQKYDEKVVSDRHEKEILRWCIGALILAIIIIFLIGYIRYKKYRSRIAFKEQQLLINGYINEIGQLKGQNDNAEYQIGELKNRVSGYNEDIRKLEESCNSSEKHIAALKGKIKEYTEQIDQLTETGNTAYHQIDSLNGIIKDYKEQIDRLNQADNASRIEVSSLKGKIEEYLEQISNLQTTHKEAEQQIADLNQKIKDLMEQESPRLAKGKLLYDQILQNGTTVEWTNDDYKCFIDFYKATNFSSYSKVMKKYSPKTAHNTFFLLLYEIGKNDKEIRQIMGITQEAIRSTRFRIQKHSSK